MKISKLAKKYHGIKASRKATRYIRLPEWPPNSTVEIRPSRDYVQGKINLLQTPTYIRTDAYGFIGPTAIHSTPDLRIAFLGSSTTENRFVDEGKRFPYVVGRMLESLMQKKVNTYNAGFRGNNIVHCMNTFINKVLCVKPDIVIVMSNIIDLNTLLMDRTYWFTHSSTRKKKFNARTLICESERNVFGRFLNLFMPTIGGKTRVLETVEEITPFGTEGYEKIFRSLVSAIISCGIWPVIMTEPGLLSAYNTQETDYKTRKVRAMTVKYAEDGYAERFRQFNDVVRTIAKDLDVAFIDLDAILSSDEANFIDLNHLSELGNQKASSVIASYISDNGSLDLGSR